LHLDERQRAMLAEMHIRVWPARSDTEAAPSAKSIEAPVTATPLAQADGTRLQAQRERVADLGWGELKAAVQQCQACALGATRSQAVWGQGAAEPDPMESHSSLSPSDLGVAQADWLVVVAAPNADDQAQGLPLMGDPGRLLDNILRAVGLQREGLGPLGHSVFITSALKCAPPQERNPQATELDMCEPHLARQIALLRPKVIVAMGLVAAQSVLRQHAERIAGLPLGRLRQQVWQHQDTPVVVTYPSAYLMRTPADKAKAWADWCMARTLALGKAG
jgi:DNA polymerase